MSIYTGVTNIAKKAKGYVGVGGVAKKLKSGYIGDANGVARKFYSAFNPSILPGATSRTISLVYGTFNTATLLTVPYSKIAEAKANGYSNLTYNWSSSYSISSPGGYGNCKLDYGASKINNQGSLEWYQWYQNHGPGYPSAGSSSSSGSYSIPLNDITTNVYFYLTGWASNGNSATFGISNVRFT